MSMVPKAARLEDGQVVYTAGFNNPLPSLYPRGLVLGYVAGHGARPSDANTRVQVTPFVELSQLAYVTVLIPESREALRRAQG